MISHIVQVIYQVYGGNMTNTLVPIQVLRSQCKEHGLDTMRTFTLKGNESPKDAYTQMEYYVRDQWKKHHGCEHTIKFTRMTDKKYRYNTKRKKVEKL